MTLAQRLRAAAEAPRLADHVIVSRDGRVGWRNPEMTDACPDGVIRHFLRVDRDDNGFWWGRAPEARAATQYPGARFPNCAYVGCSTAVGFSRRSSAIKATLRELAGHEERTTSRRAGGERT